MKQLIITFCLLLLMGTTYGQNIIERNFSAYQGQKNFTSVQISSKAFELAAYLEVEEAEEDFAEFVDFLKTVSSFQMIAGQEVENASQEYRAALAKVRRTHEELMNVQEEDGIFTFLVDESHGNVRELVLVGFESRNLVIFSLTGNMDIDQLSKMSRWMETGEDAQIQRLFENGLHELQVYPNPLQPGEPLIVESPEDTGIGTVSLFDLSGNRVKTYRLQSNRQKIETRGLTSGTYIMEFENENVRIRKKILIR